MARAVLLDSGPLGRLTNPRAEQNREVREWLAHSSPPRSSLFCRRSWTTSIAYAPLTTQVMLRAAQLWADARTRGLPTAPDGRLDIDVILAAQALDLAENSDQVVVATTNPRHLSRFVDARDWQEIEP